MGNELIGTIGIFSIIFISFWSGIGTFYFLTDTVKAQEVDMRSFNLSESIVYEAGDQKVVVIPEDHPEMEDRIGYYNTGQPNTIHLQYPRNTIKDFYTTCTHEELHSRGIRAKEHGYINGVEDSIVSGVCLEAVFQLGRHQPLEESERVYFE